MKRNLIFFAAILSIISFTASAQTGVLMGQIVVPAGSPEATVSVSLEGTSVYADADSTGSFVLKSTPGSYRLQVHATGMQFRVLPVTIDPRDTTILKRIVLERKKQQLHELVVEGQRQRYDAKNASGSLRLVTPLQQIPQNIQVITSRALGDQQVTSLAEGVIRNVSGATKLEHWSTYTRINMRGARASEFRNGMNVTSSWGPLSADMSIVDRIEFVKGPAGFMMSNGDPSGIFNIVTKKPTGVTGGEASLMFGSFDLYRATLDVDGHLDRSRKFLYRLDLMGQTENSFQANRFNNRYTLHPVITYKPDPKTALTAEYTLQYDRMSDMGTPYVFSPKGYADLPRDFTTLGTGVAPTTIEDQTLFLYLDHQFNDNWKLSVHGAYLHSSQVGSSVWPSSLDSAGEYDPLHLDRRRA